MTKGFITIATGAEEYYILARNLLHSYRYFCGERLPFALLCDRENAYTAEFDHVILFPEGASNSYLDKLCLAEFAPYDVTIFIDADCLAYGDLNVLLDHFAKADDFSCFGRVLPLDDKTGWFEYEHLGDLQGRVNYVVGLHGGIYYIKKGETSRKLLTDARSFVPNYADFCFKGKFSTPGDEPLVALAMAVNQCHPIPFIPEDICCYWEHEGEMSLDIAHGIAKCPQGGVQYPLGSLGNPVHPGAGVPEAGGPAGNSGRLRRKPGETAGRMCRPLRSTNAAGAGEMLRHPGEE